MTKITLNGHTYTIPARWSEVTDRSQFIAICQALYDYETGVTSFAELRVALAVAHHLPLHRRRAAGRIQRGHHQHPAPE